MTAAAMHRERAAAFRAQRDRLPVSMPGAAATVAGLSFWVARHERLAREATVEARHALRAVVRAVAAVPRVRTLRGRSGRPRGRRTARSSASSGDPGSAEPALAPGIHFAEEIAAENTRDGGERRYPAEPASRRRHLFNDFAAPLAARNARIDLPPTAAGGVPRHGAVRRRHLFEAEAAV